MGHVLTRKEDATSRAALTQPLKWHVDGGKSYLAPWIISHMPPRARNLNAPAADDPGWVHYVEPYVGGGSVFLQMEPGVSVVLNDLNPWLANFWSVLASEELFERFRRRMEATPFSEPLFDTCMCSVEAGRRTGDPVDDAETFFIVARMSRQGLCKDFATMTRNRTRRGMNEQASSWLGSIEGLPEVHRHLMGGVVMNKPALDVIRQQDGPRTLFYLDPPYLHETRVTTSDYAHEMTPEQHQEMLDLLATVEGRFLLSGYPSEMYRAHAERHGWRCVTREIDNKASGAAVKPKKTECLWMNY